MEVGFLSRFNHLAFAERALAMIADRVLLLPGTRVGSQAVMGTGSLGKRNATYASGSIWIGNGRLFLIFSEPMLIIFLRQRRTTMSKSWKQGRNS